MNTFILDCGQCYSHILNTNTREYSKIEHNDIIDLNIPKLQNGDRIIVEEAHMRSQENNSLAQPFTYDQLTKLQSNAQLKNVEIRLFPQKSTPTARKIASLSYPELLEKNDENDIRAIANFLKVSPQSFSTLKKFKPTTHKDYESKNMTKFADRMELNQDINLARNLTYGLKDNGYSDAVSEWIKKYLPKLSSEIRDQEILSFVGIEFQKNKPLLKDNVLNYQSDKLKRLYNIVLTILKPDGQLRVRSDVNKPAYWKYAKDVYFGITPYHMSAGVVASNYKYHLRKASSSCKYSMSLESKNPMTTLEHYYAIKEERSKSDKKLRVIWNTVRKMIVEDGLR